MELRVVKYFLAIVEEGSVTRGAAQARISQPAVSRQIAALERELGTPLFERGKGAVSLTHAGRRFLPLAEDLVRREADARKAVNPTDIQQLRLVIVTQTPSPTRAIGPFTAQHGASLPLVDTIECRPAEVYDTLRAESADLAVATVAPPSGLVSKRLCDIGLTVQVVRGHALDGRDSVEVRELVHHHPLILMDRGFSARTAFDEAVARSDAQVTDPIVLRSTVLAQAHAASGRGAAVLTDAPTAGMHAARLTVDGAQVRLTLYGAWERTHFAADAIEHWVDRFTTWLSHLPDVEELRNSPRT